MSTQYLIVSTAPPSSLHATGMCNAGHFHQRQYSHAKDRKASNVAPHIFTLSGLYQDEFAHIPKCSADTH